MNSSKRLKIAGILILAILIISVSVWGINVKNQKASVGTILGPSVPFAQYPSKTFGGFSLSEIVSNTDSGNTDKAFADLQFNIDDIKTNIKNFISIYYASNCDTTPRSDICIPTEKATLNALTTYASYITTYDELQKQSNGMTVPTTADLAGIASQSLIGTLSITGVDSVDAYLTQLSAKVNDNLTYAITNGNIPAYTPTSRADINVKMMRLLNANKVAFTTVVTPPVVVPPTDATPTTPIATTTADGTVTPPPTIVPPSDTTTPPTPINTPFSISKAGTGSGDVVASPYINTYGLNGYAGSFPSGTTVILTATPHTDSTFGGFVGNGVSCNTSPCTVTTSDIDPSITAIFTLKPVVIVTTPTVAATPTTVVVTTVATIATPTATLTPVMTATPTTPVIITPTITPIPPAVSIIATPTSPIIITPPIPNKNGIYNLTASTTGTGAGTITGLNSPYAKNQKTALIATPDSKSVFKKWTGCNSVSGSTCNVTMNKAKSVSVAFDLLPNNDIAISIDNTTPKAGTSIKLNLTHPTNIKSAKITAVNSDGTSCKVGLLTSKIFSPDICSSAWSVGKATSETLKIGKLKSAQGIDIIYTVVFADNTTKTAKTHVDVKLAYKNEGLVASVLSAVTSLLGFSTPTYTNPYAFVFGYDTDGMMDFRIVSTNPLQTIRFYDVTDLIGTVTTTKTYLDQIGVQVGIDKIQPAKDKITYYITFESEDPTANGIDSPFSGSVTISNQADLESYISGYTFLDPVMEYNLYMESRILLDEGNTTLNFNIYSDKYHQGVPLADDNGNLLSTLSPIIMASGPDGDQEAAGAWGPNVLAGPGEIGLYWCYGDGGHVIADAGIASNPLCRNSEKSDLGDYFDGLDLSKKPTVSDLRGAYQQLTYSGHTNTPILDSSSGICMALSVAYSLKYRLNTPDLTLDGEGPLVDDPQTTTTFWNQKWLEKLVDVKDDFASGIGGEEMYSKFYKDIGNPLYMSLADLASSEHTQDWNSLVDGLNSGDTDCILLTDNHASYVSKLYTYNGKKVLNIIDTLWQGEDNRISLEMQQNKSEFSFPVVKPSMTTFVFDENSVESVTTKKLDQAQSDEYMLQSTANFWKKYRIGYGTGTTYTEGYPILNRKGEINIDVPFSLFCTTPKK